MNGRLNPVLALATAALLVTPLLSARAALSAQDAQGRFRVMVPRFFPDDGTDDDFGKDTAKRIREALDALPSHVALEEGEMKEALRRYEMNYDDLAEGEEDLAPCTGFRQLGGQLNSEVALCASYREVGDDMVEIYSIEFWQLQTQQAFALEPFSIHKDADEEAAQRIMARFDEYVEQSQYRAYCGDYAQSQDWDDALRNCNLALEINPDDVAVLAQRAYVYQETGEMEKALVDLERVLEADPRHESALQRAGFVAITLGENEKGREYYGRYLQMNPGDAAVRGTIAYQAYEAGDARGAMMLIEEGLEHDPDNVGLLLYYGNYAFTAANERQQEQANTGQPQGGTTSEALDPEVADLYRKAVDALTKVYETRPDTMAVGGLRNIVVANIRLDNVERAVTIGEQVTRSHPEEAQLWDVYASALSRSGNLDQALEAMSEVERLDPQFTNLYARQGQWLLQAGRVEDAVPYLQRATERGHNPADMARLLLSRAVQNGIREDNFEYAAQVLALAKESFDLSPDDLAEYNFWHGYSIFQKAINDQTEEGKTDAQILAVARATLPRFQEARQLFVQARGYNPSNQNINIDQYLENTDAYIEIQQARIKRLGG